MADDGGLIFPDREVLSDHTDVVGRKAPASGGVEHGADVVVVALQGETELRLILRIEKAWLRSYRKGVLHLIVSNTNCDITAFRKAISQYFGIQEGEQASSRYLGLSLDGGSSSQLKAKQNGSNVYVNSVGRNLCQIVALRNE